MHPIKEAVIMLRAALKHMEGRNMNFTSLAVFAIFALSVYPSLLVFSSPVAPNATDEQALLSFKTHIATDLQGALSSWRASNATGTGTPSHFCHWQGVSCRSRRHPQRVTALELLSLNVTGTISPYLANLTFLHTLNLSYNRLSGGIPWELGRLRRLRYLDLRHNSLEGEIPLSLTHASTLRTLNLEYNNLGGEISSNFSYCEELEVFDVGANQFSGSIPPSLGSLSKLTKFGVYSNRLVGGIPPSLGNLSSLVYLMVDMAGLEGQIPDSLGQLVKLEYLDLAVNGLTGTIPPILFNISSITVFEMGSNNFSGVLPSDIGLTLPNLEYFLLYDCQLEGRIPESLVNASRLRVIQLSWNQFVGVVPLNIGNLRDLEMLTLEGNQLEAKWAKDWEMLASLGNCSNLFSLSLSSNNFQGVFPPSLLNLSTEMKEIFMSHNKIYGAIPSEIGKFMKLMLLDFGDNLLTSTIPATIGQLGSLGALDLSGNNIHGELPPTLGNLTLLTELYLFVNNLLGSIPTSLGRLSNIASIVLSYNRLSGMIPKQLVNLSSLTNYLDLSHNFLMGQIPLEIRNLKSLVRLDLSGNRLSGEIPTALGECVEMVQLFLVGNLLRGTIPRSLGAIKGIQQLDIAQNNLSGTIPEFLMALQYLDYLNLSYNNFDGPVPMEGVFSNASAFSITGNKVCGGIPMLQLPQCPALPAASNATHRARNIALISIVAGAVFLLLVILMCSFVLCARRRKCTSRSGWHFEDRHWQVSYIELQRVTNNFSEANLIGAGSFGSVYKGTLGPDSRECAIKVIDLLQHNAERSFLAECKALRSVRHRNLVKVITACSSVDHRGNDFKALVYEFMPNGSLDSWMYPSSAMDHNSRQVLTMAQRLGIALDVAAALEYLHHHHGETPVVHCDLKPSNVLLDIDMVAHVGDFGLARFVHANSSKATQDPSSSIGIKGSIGYIAPEYGMGGAVSTEGDVYSYGVMLLEMFTGKRPTDDSFQQTQTLQSYVAMACPERVLEVADPNLVPRLEESRDGIEDSFCSTLDAEKVRECIVSIFRVGLRCTEDLPRARMHIRDVARELIAVRNVLS